MLAERKDAAVLYNGWAVLLGIFTQLNHSPFAAFYFEVVDWGACPSCKTQFIGYKNQIIGCTRCGNIVWQPKGDTFRRGSSSKSKSEVIDVEFEEK